MANEKQQVDPMQPDENSVERYRHPEKIGAHYASSKGVVLLHLKFPIDLEIHKVALPEDLIAMLAQAWITARIQEKQQAMEAMRSRRHGVGLVRPS